MQKIVLVMGAALAAVSMGCAAEIVQPEPGAASDELRLACGGFAGTACPDGYTCVDDRRDSCDPDRGGADCAGVCKRARRDRCEQEGRTYVSRDPAECSLIRFVCVEGTTYFADECGCGCQDACTTIALCVEGYVWDEATCACVPEPGEPCGPVTCAAGEVCCNASCGICTPPGYFCTQQACL